MNNVANNPVHVRGVQHFQPINGYTSEQGAKQSKPEGHSFHKPPPTRTREELIAAMGLAFDPFPSGVSEHAHDLDFGAMYVESQPELLANLQKDTTNFVFADYGMGKTATRLALEYALRLNRAAPHTLAVTYTPEAMSQDTASENPIQQSYPYLHSLRTALCEDLLIQYTERLAERSTQQPASPSLFQDQALARVIRSISSTCKRNIQRNLRTEPTEGAFWKGLRPVVRHVAITDAWRNLVRLVKHTQQGQQVVPASWEQVLFDLRALDFHNVFILIDAIDQGTFDAQGYFEIIKPFISTIHDLHRQGIYLKFFLPIAIKDLVWSILAEQQISLTQPDRFAIITQMSSADLERILSDRFEAASGIAGSVRGLDWFGSRLTESIQTQLIAISNGSPRILINLVSTFLDFHCQHGFRDDDRRLWVTADEWGLFLAAARRQYSGQT